MYIYYLLKVADMFSLKDKISRLAGNRIAYLLLLALLFILAKILQDSLFGGKSGIPIIWFSGGVYVVALLRSSLADWWKIALVQILLQIPFIRQLTPYQALLYLIPPTLGPLAATWIFLKLNRGICTLDRMAELMKLFIALILGSIFVFILVLPFRFELFKTIALLNSLFAPVTGALIIVFLLFKSPEPERPEAGIAERIIYLTTAPILAFLIFNHSWPDPFEIEYHFLLFPLFFLMALRVRRMETFFALMLVISIIVAKVIQHAELQNPAPFREDPAQVLSLQMFNMVLVIGTIIITIIRDANRLSIQEIKKQENLYRTLVDTLPQRIYLKDTSSNYLSANKAFISRLGYNQNQIKGKRDTDFFPEEIAGAFVQDDAQVLATGKMIEVERIIRVQGTEELIKTIKVPFSNANGEITGILGISWDITESKKADERIRESEKRLLDAEQIAHAGNFEINLENMMVSWSAGQYILYGLPCEQTIISMEQWIEMIHPEDRHILASILQNTTPENPRFETEFRINRDDGVTRTLLCKGKRSVQQDRSGDKLLGVNLDISEIKEAELRIIKLNEELEERVKLRTRELEETLAILKEREKALRNSEEHFRALMEQSPQAISIYNTNGVLREANPAWEKLWGIKDDVLLSGNYSLFNEPGNFYGATQESFKKALKGIETIIPEIIVEKSSSPGAKEKRTIRSVLYPIQNQMGAITSVVVSNEDISKQKQVIDILKSLLRLSKETANLSIDEIIQQGLNEAVRLSNSSIGFFHFVNTDQEMLSLQAWSTGTFELCNAQGEKMHYPISKAGVWVEAVHKRAAVIHNNYAGLPDKKGLPPGHCPIIRELVVPVFEKDTLVALLGVGNKPDDYDDFDLDQLSFFAQHTWELTLAQKAEESKRKSEELYRTLVETIPEAVITVDRHGRIKYASARAAQFAGQNSIAELIGKEMGLFLGANFSYNPDEFIAKIIGRGETFYTTTSIIQPDGSSVPVELTAALLMLDKNQEPEVIISARDISERVNAESALRESEERYKKFFSENHAIMLLLHPETGMIVDANPAACDFYGYSEEELTSRNVLDICVLPPEEVELQLRDTRLHLKNHYYSKHKLSWDEVRDVDVYSGLMMISGMELLYMIVHDDSERRKGEEQLRSLAKAQTVLLREVNHRVKNNLAALISMLHIEEDRAEAAGISNYTNLLRDLVSRIRGLSTVHSLLSAKNWQPLELSMLTEKIMQASTESLPSNKTVLLHIDSSPILVGSNQAHHLAMVINEIATNSIKHALKDWDETSIKVHFTQKNRHVSIHFSDDGPGFPEEMIGGNFSNVNVGFELIRGIVTHSLNGKLKLWNENGAHLQIEFTNELQ
ncbi:MAG: PAS domain S-box protein [Bacteroidales bacterium]